MATYTYQPTSMSSGDWSDPTAWPGGMVPNSADADVIFPTVTYVGGQPFAYTVTVGAGETFNAHSVTLQNTLNVTGGLNVANSLTLNQNSSFAVGRTVNVGGDVLNAQNGSVAVTGSLAIGGTLDNAAAGTVQLTSTAPFLSTTGSVAQLHVGTLSNAGQLAGSGQITAGAVANTGTIDSTATYSHGSYSQGVIVVANSFDNTGTFLANSGYASINTPSGGFAQLSNGVLSGGTYIVNGNPGGLYAQPSTLSFNTGSVITTNAATITLNGQSATLTSQDPATGQNIPITSSLTTIASGGVLNLNTAGFTEVYTFAQPLTVAGQVTLDRSQLTNSQITITQGGTLSGTGMVNGAIVNNGTIVVGSGLTLNGPVSGTGAVEVAAGAGATTSNPVHLGAITTPNIVFDAGGSVAQIDKPSSYAGTIAASGSGDQLLLKGVTLSSVTGSSYSGDQNGGTLTLTLANGSPLALKFAGNYDLSRFTLSNGPQVLSTDVPDLVVGVGSAIPLCFVAGARIRTPDGERPVETLRVGDSVVTWTGATRPVRWIGSGASIVSAADPRTRPVIVRAGALADGVPSRDLRLTEGHSLFVDGVLMPVATLINGRSILWDDAASSVIFFHIELDTHDLLVANGAPAESYRDDGNRQHFGSAIGADSAMLAPYAPVLTEGPTVDSAWLRLAHRAGLTGAGLSDDADLHLEIAGQRIAPTHTVGGRYHFRIEGGSAAVAIVSRAVVPADVGTARDHRRLGVAIRSIAWTADAGPVAIDFDAASLADGFHAAERDGRLRWTDGRGIVRLDPAPSAPTELVIEIACFAHYPVAATIHRAAA